MEQNTQHPDETEPLEDQIRECFARVVYSHKTHEKQAELTSARLSHFKIAQIGLAALTTSGTLAVIFADDLLLKSVTALVSLVSLFVSGYMKGFDPGEIAQKHRDSAADIWEIRESYLSLLTDYVGGSIDENSAREIRNELQTRLAAIYKSAPGTTAKAYNLAQIALQKDEDYTFNPGEIDKFLTASLKRKSRKQ